MIVADFTSITDTNTNLKKLRILDFIESALKMDSVPGKKSNDFV